MAAQSGGKWHRVVQRVGGWFFRTIFRRGWRQWLMLAAAVIVFVLALLALTGGTDYREDPSALTPRSVDMYVETRDLPLFLKNVSDWEVWKEDRRVAAGGERNNQLQVDIAGLVGERVAGMSTSSPMRWLSAATRAAYCLSGAPAEEGGESWALFIEMADPSEALAEVGIERGMTLEAIRGDRDGGVFKLTGEGAGELYFGVVAPWLVVSSQARLPEFALDSMRRPAYSLANAGLLPAWKRGTTLRGVYSPALVSGSGWSPAAMIAGWMAPDVRVTCLSRVGKNGLDTTFGSGFLTDRVGGGGLWPLFSVILFVAAILAVAAAFAVLLAMVGWGGWMKARAIKAGILPASGPAPAEPSQAFKEDSGLDRPVREAGASGESGERESGKVEPAKDEEKTSESVQVVQATVETVESAEEATSVESSAESAPAASAIDDALGNEVPGLCDAADEIKPDERDDSPRTTDESST